jgi:hypothetical protein
VSQGKSRAGVREAKGAVREREAGGWWPGRARRRSEDEEDDRGIYEAVSAEGLRRIEPWAGGFSTEGRREESLSRRTAGRSRFVELRVRSLSRFAPARWVHMREVAEGVVC